MHEIRRDGINLISQFEMYKNIEEELIVEAVQDLAGCADKIHEIIYN